MNNKSQRSLTSLETPTVSGPPSLMDSLFQRTLDDLIKSLRLAPPGTEQTLITKTLDDIRREIKSTDPQTKSTALQKLTYLHSLHHAPPLTSSSISFAAFPCVELSSSTSRAHKRVAYLSASLSFDPDTTEVILLLTHQLRKDLTSPNPHDVSLALSTLSSIANPDLARDLTPEVFGLLNSSKLSVRKRAIACLLRVFEKCPDSVRVCFRRVVENLENGGGETEVLSAVVGLFCELTAREPRSYLPLAPEFYRILVDCRNNWVLIKVLKIFAKLATLEPRLARRLVEPVCEHMGRTGAKSVVYECVRTIVTSLGEYESAVRLAVGKVREFLSEDDPNLKYLGLQALVALAEKNMWAVVESKELVVRALGDVDGSIRLEALRLVMAMVSEDNVVEICRILIGHALKSDPEFSNEILGSVLSTCARNFYEVIFDFDWYVTVLGEMARIPHCQKVNEIEDQLVDIGMRVKDARPQLIHVARDLVIDPALYGNPFIHGVLAAAAWVSGEYVELSRNPFELMEALLQPRTSLLTPAVRAIYIQSAFKVLTFCLHSYLKLNEENGSSYPAALDDENVASETLSDSELDNPNIMGSSSTHERAPSAFSRAHHVTQESLMGLVNLVETNLGPLAGSNEVEVQERASNVNGLIKLMKPKILGRLDQSEGENLKASEMIMLIFNALSEELGPVSLNAQERVPVPDGLVLKENLDDLESICGDIKLSLPSSFSLVKHHKMDDTIVSGLQTKDESEPSTESTSLLAEHRKRHGLYYLPSENSKETTSSEYPIAQELKDKAIDETEDLVKLTEQSLVIKKRPNQVKPRPVVVKLDDGERFNIAAKAPEVRADLISGAVQEVLLGNEASTSRSKSSKKSSKRREVDEVNAGVPESINDATKTGSVRKHRNHSKERKNKNPVKDKEENDRKDKKKSERRHGKHKSRQRAEGALAAQSPVIPDFLL